MKDAWLEDLEEPPVESADSAEKLAVTGGPSKIRRPYSRIAFELEEDDLAVKGVQKLMLAEISRLEGEVSGLETYRDLFHERDKDCERLKVKVQMNIMVDVLYSIGISVGSALISLTTVTTSFGPTITLVGFAGALLIFSALARWKGWKK